MNEGERMSVVCSVTCKQPVVETLVEESKLVNFGEIDFDLR